MKPLATLILALLLALSAAGQPTTAPVTQPVRLPVAAFFEPTRNLARLAAMGVDTFFGPEVEAASSMTPAALAAAQQAWIDETVRLRVKCVLKRPVGNLPPNCVGVMVIFDEANGKGIPPDAVKANADVLRAQYPGVRIFASLAGDKITSANLRKPAELALLQGYLAAADVVTVDVYSFNRNASRYKTTWTADAVKTVLAVRPDVECWAWIESNDQRLSPPTPPDVNRAPTPQEIDDTAEQAIAAGARGIGWFLTCDSGKYGWPGSYMPDVDRNGVSMQPQYDKLAEVSHRHNPALPAPATLPVPSTLPTTQPDPIATLAAKVDALTAEIVAMKATVADLTAKQATAQAATDAKFEAVRQALQPATRPSN